MSELAGAFLLGTSTRTEKTADAIRFILDQLVAAGVLASPKDLGAVAFKTVMGGDWAASCFSSIRLPWSRVSDLV